MATGLALTVVQTLFSALQTQDLKNLCSMFGYESQLTDMEHTVETIKAVLLDAESKHHELNNLGKDWLGKLKDVVYDADDLFDEFNTIAQQQKRLSCGKISKKRREDTSSYVYESSIIGRDADKEEILTMLLGDSDSSSDARDDVSFVSIVGIGGLGKTALAQLVFNDERIQSAFELSLWVCVSEEFCMKDIFLKMLGKSCEFNVEELYRQVRRKIEGKRYFLVLDDVWNESRNEWAKLREFLLLGARGSKIIVTTRSKRVARAIGEYPIHELKSLSDNNSWCLFKTIAFNQESKKVDDPLIKIGKSIVKKCANVPLSIRVIGSLLYDQDESKWLSFQRLNFAEIGQCEDGVMPILKFSYYHLTPQLKSCFSYCALFPKNHQIEKALLINIWLAQGCLECPNETRNVEDVGDECFSNLLYRCFFQEIKSDDFGGIKYVKMHDLIHDLAQQVAGQEWCMMMDASTSQVTEKTRHVSVVGQRRPFPNYLSDTLGNLRTMRTFFIPSLFNGIGWDSIVGVLLGNCRRLRVLDLHSFDIKVIHNTFKNLIHLRYLDLSYNRLRLLPKSISKLYNLQVLNLHSCCWLELLPENLRELVNLRQLDITHCDSLNFMPTGMGSMIGLRTLTMFVLGGAVSHQGQNGQLKDLMPLINLRGNLYIKFTPGYSYDAESGGCLLNKKHITALRIHESESSIHDFRLRRTPRPMIVNERLLGGLEPHRDLRELTIEGYNDIKLPSWTMSLATSFPNLAAIDLQNLYEVKRLPQLSQLCHLKSLTLANMRNVEYMEDVYNNDKLTFYPSLEKLALLRLPKLKGWWREVDVGRESVIHAFNRVHKLEITECPEFISIFKCPNMKIFSVLEFNEALTFCSKIEEASLNPTTSESACIDTHVVHYLDRLTIDNVGAMSSIFGDSLQGISYLRIENSKVESLSTVVESYLKYASSTKFLTIRFCKNLKRLSRGGIEHLTNLQKLIIDNCINLNLEEEEDGMPWKAFHNLSSLDLKYLPKLVNLPNGIQYLSSLQQLYIYICENLESLPEWLDCLTSLRELTIIRSHKLRSLPEAISRLSSLTGLYLSGCPVLMERCREPDGQDWPKIRHIPTLHFT